MLLDNLYLALGGQGTCLILLSILFLIATAAVLGVLFPVRPFHRRFPPGR